MGRASSAFWTLVAVPMSVGAAGTAAIARRFSAATTRFGLGVGMLALALVASRAPVRAAHPERRPVLPASATAPAAE